MCLIHKWEWHWDPPASSVYSIKTRKRMITKATGWFECDKCHKTDRAALFKEWWSR